MAVLPHPAPDCASCAARDAVIAGQAAAIEELKADVVALATEVRDLRRRLGRNSGNSSMAPSADDLPGRPPPLAKPKRGKGGRKPGKQPGAPGSHLAWSESPDERVPHFPAGACECGADLAAAADLGVAGSHQLIDIPLETAKVTQHDLHEVACGCGRVHRAAAPAAAGAPGTVTYGLTLQAWVCVPDRGACDPGAPLRRADRGADRRGALARVRALHDRPRRRRWRRRTGGSSPT